MVKGCYKPKVEAVGKALSQDRASPANNDNVALCGECGDLAGKKPVDLAVCLPVR